MTMRNSLLTVLGSVMLLGAVMPAHSESVLRIGLGADPDMLDPHLARTYYGASSLPPCATGWWMWMKT